MSDPWYRPIIQTCEDACTAAGSSLDPRVVTFYTARWCQKQAKDPEPDLAALGTDSLRESAARIVQHLTDDGALVERLVAGDADSWTELRRQLFASARSRAPAEAAHHADEALQKIAILLLTGTPPSRAPGRLIEGPEGPGGEYIFTSPLSLWARKVAINLIIDEKRRAASLRTGPRVRASSGGERIDMTTLRRAYEALPSLLDAVRTLPPVQRSVMVTTLARGALDPEVKTHLRKLAPDLFSHDGDMSVRDDADIAACLGTTARLVAANRSAARCRLAARDPAWALLLDALMPHRSTARTAMREDSPDG